MRTVLFSSSIFVTIYAAMRIEWVGYLAVGTFIGGSVFAITYSLYRHLRASRFYL